MGSRVRLWSLLASPGGVAVVVGGLLVMALVVAVAVWWPSPATAPETTDAPPPTPLADEPPAMPTEELWWASSRWVLLAPGGYVVLAGETLAVRDLYTGELRWEFSHSEPYHANVQLIGADRMVVEFGARGRGSTELAFHIPSGEQLEVREARAAIRAAESDHEPPTLRDPDACGPSLDSSLAGDQETWMVLLDCDEHITAVALTDTGEVRWETELPVAAADFEEVTVADLGYGAALVHATEATLGDTGDQVFVVDLDSGEASTPVPVGEHFSGPLSPAHMAAVPAGFCAWGGSLDLSIACYDRTGAEPRWHRHDDPVSARWPAAVVLSGGTLLFLSDEHPSRWVGYRLSDGEPRFDLDRRLPRYPRVAQFDHGVLAVIGDGDDRGSTIVVYGDAEDRAD